MILSDEITTANIADHLKQRLNGTFRWPLLQELLSRLESAGNNTKEIVAINKWFKEELERLVGSEKEDEDSRKVSVAQSLLDLVAMKSNFTTNSEEEIFIHTAQYVKDEVFQIKKGCEIENKSTFSFDLAVTVPYYKCHNASAALVDEAINDKILRFANLFKEFCNSKGLQCEFKPLRTDSETDVTVYGRIGAEGESGIDILNVTLQGSTTNDFGVRAQIENLHQIEELCLFPGQMVGFSPSNKSSQAAVTGRCFEDNFGVRYVTSNIRCGIPVDEPVTTLAAQNKFKNENIHISVIRGALLTENLEQTNFQYVFHKLKRDKPHVVFFMGPFVSVNQMAVEGYGISRLGDLTFLYSKFLKDLSNVAQFGPMSNTKFVIVPHCYDVLLSYPLPQPPLNCASSPLYKKEFPENIIFLSNPGTISINGILFGVTSCDVISGIEKNMVCKPKEDSVRLICQQLLQQRSLFPSYPASKLPAEYAVDHSMLRQLEFSNETIPDIVLFSSSAKSEPFVEFTNHRAFISCHNVMVPKNQTVQSVTEIYVTPQTDVGGLIVPMDIDKRVSLAVSILQE
ncbi:conserved hypothetical protein [Theileria equi strain WA]|uniref:DNA polymerase alpha subunit B n=1 Tax=Theileria equi strain WA TaxID=1537102 RepID=L1LDH0_THEEQ|nr:conserved hypothetical protein [Theileria equi strain WA]EKX73396.1 conserved hypothetical protein [Theileria equi strain WA]|eukprot:XP_004832848.1 conserved hypothetical protein [Theileria equi strain WA]